MRLHRSLAGRWRFQLDPEGVLQAGQLQPDREITVPMPWQAALPELERYSGYGWYQTTFELDAAWLSGEVLLRFGAVDYRAEIYVNDTRVGEHEGGYTPFEFPVRAAVREGANTLTVRVYDAAQQAIVVPRWRDNPAAPRSEVDPVDMPHGKQTWYLDASGIWQDVTLTAVPVAHIDYVHVTPNIHSNEAKVAVELAGTVGSGTLSATIDGQSVSLPLVAGQNRYELTVHVPDAKRWSLESPNLYTAVVALDGDHTDELSTRFGFREIRTEGGLLLLNGEPVYLLSALDQDLYPETIYTAPSADYLRDEFAKAKQLGLNSLRIHIKPPEPIYLDLADEMGLLIWAEIPSWRTFVPKTRVYPNVLDDALQARVRQTLEEMVREHFNHPSLMVWTIVNEDWGTMLGLREEDRVWLSSMVDYCRQLDPTRLVVDNSACGNPWGRNVHVKTDLNDYHMYNNIPEKTHEWAAFIEEFSMRPGWLFAQDGTAFPRGDEPLILSEFGNWGMPKLAEMTRDGEPSWFDLGPWWSSWDGEPGFPEGVQKRFHTLGLDKIWADYDTFAAASQRLQFAALKYEIETMRRFPTVQGYVITELTDIYWESNGLMDFYRQPKVYHDEFSQFNAEDVIVPQLSRWAYWDDETLSIRLFTSHYSAQDWQGALFQADFNDEAVTGLLEPTAPRGDVRALGEYDWQFAPVETAAVQTLSAEVTSASGEMLAQAYSPVLVLPSEYRHAAYSQPINIFDSGVGGELSPSKLAADLWQLGYQTDEGEGKLCIADAVNAPLLDWVAQGNDLLLLSGGRNPFFWQHGRGGAYSGDWMGSFNWLRPGVYQRLATVDNPITLPFTGITPGSVLLGLPVEDATYQRDFLAGQVTGWLGHPAVHTVQFRYGAGRVVMTTYRLKDALTTHPLAAAMLHDLVDYLVSEACAPALTVKL